MAAVRNYKAWEYARCFVDDLVSSGSFVYASTLVNAHQRILNLATCATKAPHWNTLAADTKLCASEMMLLEYVFWRSD